MSDINYQFFPRSHGMTDSVASVVEVFRAHQNSISSNKFTLSSNEVLEHIRRDLENIGFVVEKGKKESDKIPVPVLYGINGKLDKSFHADAVSKDGKTVIEVEAGRAVSNNQFLKDIFQASMMYNVEFLIVAVRNHYRNSNDFEKVYAFLETMYISNRISLPLKGILLIGY